VLIELDDSGSMDWEILTTRHWTYCDYDRNAQVKPYNNLALDKLDNVCDSEMRDDGLWLSHTGGSTVIFEYIYNNSDASYSIGCTGNNRQALYECNGALPSNTPYQNDWRILSSDFNRLYYDPKETYIPWRGPCDSSGTACGNASFSSARSNPRNGTPGYSLTRNLDQFTWETWVDSSGYTGTRPYRGNDINATKEANGVIDLWDSHISYEIDGSIITVTTTTYAPDSTGLHPTVATTTLTGSGCFTELASNFQNCRTIDQVKQNAANWYQYARKRQFVAKGGISAVMDNVSGFRYGLDTINQTSSFIELPTGLGNFAAHNDSLLDELFSFDWPGKATPLREGLQRAGDYFDHDGANNLGLTNPIGYSCQKNFSILLTDGYWNGNDPGVGDVDADGFFNTMADVALEYYNHDLHTGMANNVEPDEFDPATYQHLVTYTIAFGLEGLLQDTDPPGTTVGNPQVFGQGSGWPNPALTASGNWGDPTSCTDCAEKIDDLWHAAYNSRGTFISASTPGSVVAGLKKAIRSVQSRTGSASSVALNTGVIQTNTKIYQARFIDIDWHGELLSIPVAADGTPNISSAIDAGRRIQPHGSRVMMTHNGTEGVLFEWTSGSTALSVAQQAWLNTDATGSTDVAGMQRLAWLRGDQSNERQYGGVFRNRTNSILGDIVNSAPTFVGAPEARYPDIWSGGSGAPENCASCQTYSTFKQTYLSRTPMIYAGTNGGTLNGFNADFTASSVEKLAYIPGPVFRNLSQLMDPDYDHHYYVDGSPTIVDAFFSSDQKWHTVLAGGLNKGGQGIYALDVTNPAGFAATATSAQNVVLWEFTDADDPDLGFTYSYPAIVRMHNGTWAAVFGNGYNNSDNDGNQSTTGHAVLFILNIETGALIRKIDTGVGSTSTPNGLATPAVVDTNGDFIADTIYAGDLEGNLWKFDVTDTDPANWDVAFHDASSAAEPLYIARDSLGNRQPITVRPDAGRGPNSRQDMLYFGTGMYMQAADLSNTGTQTFYGILDTGSSFTGRNSLAAQTVDFQGTFSGTPVRVTSDNPADTRGWYMDLPDSGERNVSNPFLRAGRIIFVTVIPDSDVCNSGGNSWLMELNAINGSRLDESPFDLNGDGVFTLADYVPVNYDVDGDGDVDSDDRLPASGKGFKSLIPKPGILSDGKTEFKYTPSSTGGLEVTKENPGKTAVGRQSWGQLR
jgi:type IV pilus assembly protein PilY1